MSVLGFRINLDTPPAFPSEIPQPANRVLSRFLAVPFVFGASASKTKSVPSEEEVPEEPVPTIDESKDEPVVEEAPVEEVQD